jgi:DNA-binding MarR family transcriptional regulator
MYIPDPQIRIFAVESLMRARSKLGRPARLSKSEYEMLAAFRYQLRQYVHFSNLAAQAAFLTPRQYEALLAIKGFPGRDAITVGELAGQLQIAHHSAVGLVDRSVEQELLVREQGSDDRRQVFVRLSERGENVLEKLVEMHRREVRRLGPRMEFLLESLMIDE